MYTNECTPCCDRQPILRVLPLRLEGYEDPVKYVCPNCGREGAAQYDEAAALRSWETMRVQTAPRARARVWQPSYDAFAVWAPAAFLTVAGGARV